MKDEHELSIPEHLTIDINSLNVKQRIVYNLVTDWMLRKKQDINTKPFYLNLCGSAGCGKSYLLKAITQFSLQNDMPHFIKRAAPTANAAYQIDGTTLHALLRIPVPIAKNKPVPELNGEDLRRLQEQFKETHLLIVDEKSMVGLEILMS